MKKRSRDPYFTWKVINMILAGIVIFLAILIVPGNGSIFQVLGALFLGTVLCALNGIMELSKNRKLLGYVCSVFAGIFLVAFIFCAVRQVW